MTAGTWLVDPFVFEGDIYSDTAIGEIILGYSGYLDPDSQVWTYNFDKPKTAAVCLFTINTLLNEKLYLLDYSCTSIPYRTKFRRTKVPRFQVGAENFVRRNFVR